MTNFNKRIAVISLAALAAFAATLGIATAEGTFTQERAVEQALRAHPGKMTKAYREMNRGQEVWEVKISGEDGKEWKIYYDMEGNAIKEKSG